MSTTTVLVIQQYRHISKQ